MTTRETRTGGASELKYVTVYGLKVCARSLAAAINQSAYRQGPI
jgi:hypothetical protein